MGASELILPRMLLASEDAHLPDIYIFDKNIKRDQLILLIDNSNLHI